MVHLNGRQEWGDKQAGTGCTVSQLVGAYKVVHHITITQIGESFTLFGHRRLSNHFLKVTIDNAHKYF